MSDAAALPPRRSPRILLIVSLFLNVFLVAVIVVGAMRILHRGFERAADAGLAGPRAVMLALPRSEQPKIQAVIDRHEPAVRELRRLAAEKRFAAFKEMSAADFDPVRLNVALEAVHAADAALEEEAVHAIGDTVAQLTPAERQAMAEKAQRRARFWRRMN